MDQERSKGLLIELFFPGNDKINGFLITLPSWNSETNVRIMPQRYQGVQEKEESRLPAHSVHSLARLCRHEAKRTPGSKLVF